MPRAFSNWSEARGHAAANATSRSAQAALAAVPVHVLEQRVRGASGHRFSSLHERLPPPLRIRIRNTYGLFANFDFFKHTPFSILIHTTSTQVQGSRFKVDYDIFRYNHKFCQNARAVRGRVSRRERVWLTGQARSGGSRQQTGVEGSKRSS